MLPSAATIYSPDTARDLADALRLLSAGNEPIEIYGNRSKHLWGGPIAEGRAAICTKALNRTLQYEASDLTISVEAGAKLRDIQSNLAKDGLMLALDPPHADSCTVGGLLATNASGPMRRGYGTSRDLVIGMSLATLDGRLIQTGGMVVKNVAGLDMAKLFLGSFGTLFVLVSANFRLHAKPETTTTFLFERADCSSVVEKRDLLLRSPLRPMAINILNATAAARVNRRGPVLAVKAGGSAAVLNRYRRELGEMEVIEGKNEENLWDRVREFTPAFMEENPDGVVVRVLSKLDAIGTLLQMSSAPAVSCAASGSTCLYFDSWAACNAAWPDLEKLGVKAIVEAAGDRSGHARLCSVPTSQGEAQSAALMKRLKSLFDPCSLLNRGRLYARI